MDKRGRPIHSTTTEDLKKYYAVESSESGNDDEDEDLDERPEGGDENAAGGDATVKPKSKRVDAQATSAECDDGTGGDEEDSEAADDTEDEDEDSESQASSDEPKEPERDPARGIGNVETSSEEDESSEASGQVGLSVCNWPAELVQMPPGRTERASRRAESAGLRQVDIVRPICSAHVNAHWSGYCQR
ncbi:transcription initiation factor TFIID subunit 11-like [Dermacentor albipictus]|uniref:transcription initiation factor TFIID subunit 11-like n=1 Tax=Dermacentor albipictus TaxID=60249 RepID=UPI0038FC9EC6